MKRIISAILITGFLVGATSCGFLDKYLPRSSDNTNNSTATTAQSDEEQIRSLSKQALTALKVKDMESFSKLVYPEKGVRFTPYGYIDKENDVVFTVEQLKNAFSNQKKYLWGHFDGTGDPMELTFEEYYNKFIYDVDFLEAPQVGYNKVLGQGNSLNNSAEVYPDANIIEYHFPEIDPQYEGMDWRSLKLVFEKKDNNWYIVGVIHNQWTI